MSALLATKLHIPRLRRELVYRPRLIERLQAELEQKHGFARKLTLVSAPAGYGKTTLVSDWIQRRGAGITAPPRVAWLSLDTADNDPARFFSYVIAALQGIDPSIGAAIQPILETDAQAVIEVEPVVTALVNDVVNSTGDGETLSQAQAVASSDPGFLLVLDDYHVIREFKIHQALDFWFDHLPPGMHMVIISRTDPPMPLGRLRVQRELTEIREADLRFTLDEATTFLNDLMELALSTTEIATLEARTEGWIAGLQLAALSLQGRADRQDQILALSGSHRHVIDYLVQEVLSRQPETVQQFLLHTSILERFNASLCEAVCPPQPPPGAAQRATGQASTPSSSLLGALERANLFLIPLDDEGHWYRYHHLFGDFLRQRLHETQPEIVPQLYIRASQWYEAQRMVNEAIELAFSGKHLLRAAQLLDAHAETLLLSRSAVNKVIEWAERLPVEVRRKFPRLCIYYAWAAQFEYRLEQVEPALALAEAHLEHAEDLPRAERAATFSARQIAGHAAAIRAYTALHRGESERAVEMLLATLKAPPGTQVDDVHAADGRPARETLVLQGAILLGLGIGYFNLGQLEAAYEAVQSALPLNQQADSRYPTLACIQHLMFIDGARGALTRAIAHGEKGLFWIEEWSRSEGRRRRPARMLAHLRLQMGQVQYERNDLEQAAANLHKATEYYELVGSWSRVHSYARLVDLHQAIGDIEGALDHLRRLRRISLTPGLSLPNIPLSALIAERDLLLSRLRPDRQDLFAEAVDWAQSSGLNPNDAACYPQEYEYLTLARVLIAQKRAPEAIPLLDRLIAAAEAGGRQGHLITYLSLQAVAHHAQNGTDRALTHLSCALALAESEGYVRTFVDLGPPMRDLLQAAARRGIASTYVSRLLAAFAGFEPHTLLTPATQREQRGVEDLVEPLNERELQILRLLAARLSYREIAQELYLSLNTIKWYTKNIYDKLGVNKRSQAVSRARELALL